MNTEIIVNDIVLKYLDAMKQAETVSALNDKYNQSKGAIYALSRTRTIDENKRDTFHALLEQVYASALQAVH